MASLILARMLPGAVVEHGRALSVHRDSGYETSAPHVWIEIDGQIFDVTATQFGLSPVILAPVESLVLPGRSRWSLGPPSSRAGKGLRTEDGYFDLVYARMDAVDPGEIEEWACGSRREISMMVKWVERILSDQPLPRFLAEFWRYKIDLSSPSNPVNAEREAVLRSLLQRNRFRVA